MPKTRGVARPLALLIAIALAAVACGNDDSPSSSPSTTAPEAPTTTEAPATDGDEAPSTTQAPTTTEAATTTEAPAPTTTEAPEILTILVTNDDGVAAPGIDALVTALTALPDVDVTVVAPAENQSGTAMNLTDGPLESSETTTASGYPSIAVAGFPADAVAWAIANLDTEFDVVVSGSNSGQNIGPFHLLSGTVGSVRYAAQQGIPGVAVSTGFIVDSDDFEFAPAVDAAVGWVQDHRDDYEAGEVTLFSINAASCTDGGRGPLEAPLATDFGDRDATAYDCASTETDPVDDVDAFLFGYAAVTELPIEV